LSHHYFCSERCHRRFLLKESLRAFLNPVGEVLQPIWQFVLSWLSEKTGTKKRRQHAWKLHDFVLSFIAVLLLSSPLIGIAILWRENQQLQNRLDHLEHLWKTAAPAKNSLVASEADRAFLRLDKPAAAMVTGNQITIEGEAPDGQVITLAQNDWVLAVTLSSGGHFTLPPVKLKPGRNQFVVRAMDTAGKTTALQHLAISSGRPTANYLAKDLSRGSLERKQVSLTFDGGSTDNATAQILDILKENHLQVTIFLTGGFIQKFPEMTRRILEEGHEIGNHTWSHPHLTSYAADKHNVTLPNVTREFLHDQLQRTAQLFEEVTGRKMAPFWRAPYGEHNEQIRQWAAELGYRHVGWTMGRNRQESMDTLDWVADTSSGAYHPAAEILAHLLDMAENEAHGINGGIILTHLGSHRQDGDHFYMVLPRLISGLRDKNYAIVKISELAE
jgi:peptidoglycan-N-acetylmuramic acid deacetylase